MYPVFLHNPSPVSCVLLISAKTVCRVLLTPPPCDQTRPGLCPPPGSGAVSLLQRSLTNFTSHCLELLESNKDPDEVEELRVNSNMERDKDENDEAEREEGAF